MGTTKKVYRSGLERSLAAQLEARGVEFEYESKVIQYTQPVKTRRYITDFVLPNGIIVETKGRLITADRQKHLLIKTQHPELDIRFLFGRASNPIYTGSKVTYAKWADDNGFKWAEKVIPESWLREEGRCAR